MNCPKCLAKMPDDAKFCTECGTALSTDVDASAPSDESNGTAKKPGKARIIALTVAILVAVLGISAAIGIHEQAEERRRDIEWERKRRQEELNRQCPNINAHFDYFNGRKVHVEECRNCHGRGCHACGGTGWMRCIACGGRGFVY